MFEFPEAKRVRREEITSLSSSAPSSLELHPDDNAYALLEKLLDFDTFTVENQPTSTDNFKGQAASFNVKEAITGEEEEREFEFRLFGAPTKRQTAADTEYSNATGRKDPSTQRLRIRIRSPTPRPLTPNEGRFMVPFRGWQYYFTSPTLMKSGQHAGTDSAIAAAKRIEYEEAALTGSQLLDMAGRGVWPGCHLPWRVMKLKQEQFKIPRNTIPESGISIVSTGTHQTKNRKKKKPGKKRRIVMRKRVEAVEAAKQTDAEKRNQKNRKKRSRRRQKERERKAALASSGGGGNGNNTYGEGTGALPDDVAESGK